MRHFLRDHQDLPAEICDIVVDFCENVPTFLYAL